MEPGAPSPDDPDAENGATYFTWAAGAGLPHYYDRAGDPLTLWEWAELFEDHWYRHVATDYLGRWRVSTIWLGLDHNFGCLGPLATFETMVFTPSREVEGYQERHESERAAVEGHARAVAWVRRQRRPWRWAWRHLTARIGPGRL